MGVDDDGHTQERGGEDVRPTRGGVRTIGSSLVGRPRPEDDTRTSRGGRGPPS